VIPPFKLIILVIFKDPNIGAKYKYEEQQREKTRNG